MEFYLYVNGAKRGPFSVQQVQTYLHESLLQPGDLGSEHFNGEWKALSTFQNLATALPVESAPVIAASSDLRGPLPVEPSAPSPNVVADLRPLPVETLGPYSRATLAPNETPYYRTSLHWIVFARFAVLGFVLFLFAAIPFAIAVQAITGSELGWFTLPLPAFVLVPPALAFASSELVITDRRVLIKTGIISRQSTEVFIAKVESITVDQGFLGRIFDYGTVRIRGTGGFEEAFESIARPLLFRNWVQRLQTAESKG